jgi:hypothetical protein
LQFTEDYARLLRGSTSSGARLLRGSTSSGARFLRGSTSSGARFLQGLDFFRGSISSGARFLRGPADEGVGCARPPARHFSLSAAELDLASLGTQTVLAKLPSGKMSRGLRVLIGRNRLPRRLAVRGIGDTGFYGPRTDCVNLCERPSFVGVSVLLGLCGRPNIAERADPVNLCRCLNSAKLQTGREPSG